MGLLEGKNALIFGVANKNSIGWGVAQSFHREGAKIGLSYAGESLERRVKPLGESIGCTFMEQCDVSRDEDMDVLFAKAKAHFGTVDIIIHSIGYSPKDDLGGRYSDMSREGFLLTINISAYSFIAMAKRAREIMPNGGTMIAMTFIAAERVMPNYNAMAAAKAVLENAVRYLAADLGPEGIRVNAISAGPIKTLAGSGISGFRRMLRASEKVSPLRKLVTQEEVGDASVFLSSEWGRSITGEIMHIDAGYNVLGYTATEEEVLGDEDEG